MNHTPSSESLRLPAFRWSVLISCVAGVLFSVQIFLTGMVGPIFRNMFADFGSELPALTKFVIAARPLWLVVGLGGAGLCIFFYLQVRRGSRTAFRLGALVSLIIFLVAQTLAIALFLPIFQMAQVIGEDAKALPVEDGLSAATAVILKESTIKEGIAAEDAWLRRRYPSFRRCADTVVPTKEQKTDEEIVHFAHRTDVVGGRMISVVCVVLPDGKEHEFYFDVTACYETEAKRSGNQSAQPTVAIPSLPSSGR